jgi:hypothetical protein
MSESEEVTFSHLNLEGAPARRAAIYLAPRKSLDYSPNSFMLKKNVWAIVAYLASVGALSPVSKASAHCQTASRENCNQTRTSLIFDLSDPIAKDSPQEYYPVATKVPGKPGYVVSPYAPNRGIIDVEGYPPGSECKCPFTGNIFIVP